MSIAAVESYLKDELLVVKVIASDGSFGWGQAAPYHADITRAVLHRQVLPHVLGKNEGDFTLADQIILHEYKFTGSYICRAAAAIDTALWDLKGRRENRSVSGIIGRRREKIALYGSSMQRNLPVEQEAERLLAMRKERGYQAFKLHVNVPNGNNADYWPGRTESMVRRARRALGDRTGLYVDVNGAYTADNAIRMGRLFQENGVSLYEEPVPYWEVEETARVREAFAGSGLEVSGGEQDNSMAQWRRIYRLHAVDVQQADVCYIGGFTRAITCAQMAADEGIATTPHTANNSMLLAFGLHLMAVVEKPWKQMEHSIETDRWVEGFFDQPLTTTDGYLAVPDGPGWGVQPSEAWQASAERRITRA